MRRTTLGAGLALGTLCVAMVVAGCSGGSNSHGTSSAAPEQRVAANGAVAATAPSARSATGSSGSTDVKTALVTPARILTASITVEIAHARDVAARADAADQLAIRAGGEVDSDDRTSGPSAAATIVLRVPPVALTSSLKALAELGRATSQRSSSRDVTTQVADVSSRVTSAQAAITRLRTLYARSTKVSDVIAVEQELSTREADLESLQAQQRSLDGQTSLATVTVSLRTAQAHAPAAKPSHHQGGFVGGLRTGWDAFVHTGAAIGTGLGAALPFLLVVLLIGVGLRLGWRRRTSRLRPSPDQ